MTMDMLREIILPFLGTMAGAGCVFFLKGAMPRPFERALTGFAAGVMVAASVWSLLIPSMEEAAYLGKLSSPRRHRPVAGLPLLNDPGPAGASPAHAQ